MNLNRILFSFTLAVAAGVLILAAPSRAQQPQSLGKRLSQMRFADPQDLKLGAGRVR